MKQITETEISCLLNLLYELRFYDAVDTDSVDECIEILESLQNYEEPDE